MKRIKYLEIKSHIHNPEAEEITREVRKYFELTGKENTLYENLRNITKAVFRGKLMALSNIRKEISQLVL